MRRRRIIMALGAVTLARPVRAQDWPQHPVRILVGFPPGGFTDILARVIAPRLQERFGQPFVVENRPGAAGIIAAEAVAKAPPDGLMLLLAHPTAIAIAPALSQRLPYDGMAAFTPVTLLAQQPHVLLVKGDAPWRSLAELVEDARRRPGMLTYASSGVGSVQHVQGELFAAAAGIELVHVPYRGSGPTMTDLAAGNVSMVIDGVAVSAPLVESGRLRVLATSAARRLPRYPDLPTLAESGLEGVVPGSWFGLLAPAGTPPAIVQALARAATEALPTPEVARAMERASAEPGGLSPEEFAAFVRAEDARYRALAARTRISMD
ncbi:tripartite tricarboxylate transporter substrate binding protein [Siccirubricoccus sp. G192]|uniref:Bug family tripartite tricarboxylate transporter substrate binding protein n=1 Tax=Siccirubricoccus sp. G192 TaxID=2849651 RepID=UPI001C2C6FEB|nr:tripartite tricarboxylate transporter substrate binding protein [Siccirubricoccus sp. G192]MBV1796718.1 tripartite tricarboxylate transporter substrate binding protein [Siccirubricoccus sp. G192]